ncbi:hypothetical protein [Streptomyces orinoci]|uniref:Lipoprotein n=1 Tax=Streptomyces orinoci TaxID=67339 RepID=A0ABV3JW01_STRON|nr:hypothetical protein [Streptomyces orinoci]
MSSRARVRRTAVALPLVCSLLLVAPACGGGGKKESKSEASPTTSAEKQKFAKTRFVANAGLAAGATYKWIVKPYKEGAFKKGEKGRVKALAKAALAGTFTYNRLKAAKKNAEGDPTLSKALAPVAAGIESLKGLPGKLKNGDSVDGDVNNYQDVINKVKDAGKSAGAEVKDKTPSSSELTHSGG